MNKKLEKEILEKSEEYRQAVAVLADAFAEASKQITLAFKSVQTLFKDAGLLDEKGNLTEKAKRLIKEEASKK